MILFLKHAGITVLIMAAVPAALLAIASFYAQGMSDAEYDDSAKRCGVWSTIFFIFCLFAIFALSGCAETRTLYDACRSGLCR